MTNRNNKPYTLDEMRAVDAITARYMGGYNNGLRATETLATEVEQLRRERDELAAFIRQKRDVLEVPTEIFNLCIQNM